ncbi:MAG: ATP-dependent Clp protease proteolytic subunit, partial [Alistipes sp.]|nr:ATP-dependent Clp protease proteolytic subunit [Alistipes sp.]
PPGRRPVQSRRIRQARPAARDCPPRHIRQKTAASVTYTIEQIEADADRDYWLTAAEAAEYGLIDKVLTRR